MAVTCPVSRWEIMLDSATAEDVYATDGVTVHIADCLDVLRALPADSVHAIVTDPPYGLGFLGRAWDELPPGVEWAVECLRVLRPGGHLLAFGGTRTHHRLVCAIEDAGFEIRDSITWLYGSGFPKSFDVGKAIDKTRDDRLDVVRVTAWLAEQATARGISRPAVDAHMGTSDMACWWMTTLAHRCQVPTVEQWEKLRTLIGFDTTMDDEVQRLNGRKGQRGEAWDRREVVGQGYRVRRESSVDIAGASAGAFDLTAPATDASRRWTGYGTTLKPASEPIVVARKPLSGTVAANVLTHGVGALNIDGCRIGEARRWPANIVLSHTSTLDGMDLCGDECADGCPVAGLGEQAKYFPAFRYQAKAPARERPTVDGVTHPTVKPLALMRWLVRLVTPPDGTVLDPFAGSGTTLQAARDEGFEAIGIERDPQYALLILQRLTTG